MVRATLIILLVLSSILFGYALGSIHRHEDAMQKLERELKQEELEHIRMLNMRLKIQEDLR